MAATVDTLQCTWHMLNFSLPLYHLPKAEQSHLAPLDCSYYRKANKKDVWRSPPRKNKEKHKRTDQAFPLSSSSELDSHVLKYVATFITRTRWRIRPKRTQPFLSTEAQRPRAQQNSRTALITIQLFSAVCGHHKGHVGHDQGEQKNSKRGEQPYSPFNCSQSYVATTKDM